MKALIVDDDLALADVVAFTLTRAGFQTVLAHDGLAALDRWRDETPDVIILDLNLPRLDGLAVCRRIRAEDDIPIIMLSVRDEDEDIVTGLKLGADDYIPKPFSIKVLLAKIESVLRRVNSQEQSLLRYKDLLLNQEEHKVYALGQEVTLTNKEFELLSLFLKKPKKVFHRNQLLNSIWGYDSETYTRTVDAHVSSLRKKLGEPGKMIRSIPKVGYGLDI